MKLININIIKNFHMIPLWKSPIKLPVELPVAATRCGYPLRLPVASVQTRCYPLRLPVEKEASVQTVT